MLKELETVMSMEGAFKVYREQYKSAAGPCIPYIGVSLQDLTFGKTQFLLVVSNYFKSMKIQTCADK